MAESFRVQVDGLEVFQRISDQLQGSLPKSVFAAAVVGAGILSEKTRDVFKPGTGDLSRSFQAAPSKSERANEYSAEAYSELVYAGIQDSGETIRPKTRKNLAIPVNGVKRGTWPRNYSQRSKLVFVPSRRGGNVTGVLGIPRRSRGKGARRRILEIKFVLMKQVTIPKTDYVASSIPAIEKEAVDIIVNGIDPGIA